MEAIEFWCAFCGEPTSISVDEYGGADQSYYEDCQVCCRPHRIHVRVDPETLALDVSAVGEA